MEYLLTSFGGDHERVFDVPEGPLNQDAVAVGLAMLHMQSIALKVGYLFHLDADRWFVRLELP